MNPNRPQYSHNAPRAPRFNKPLFETRPPQQAFVGSARPNYGNAPPNRHFPTPNSAFQNRMIRPPAPRQIESRLIRPHSLQSVLAGKAPGGVGLGRAQRPQQQQPNRPQINQAVRAQLGQRQTELPSRPTAVPAQTPQGDSTKQTVAVPFKSESSPASTSAQQEAIVPANAESRKEVPLNKDPQQQRASDTSHVKPSVQSSVPAARSVQGDRSKPHQDARTTNQRSNSGSTANRSPYIQRESHSSRDAHRSASSNTIAASTARGSSFQQSGNRYPRHSSFTLPSARLHHSGPSDERSIDKSGESSGNVNKSAGGRTRLFFGNIPTDFSESELQDMAREHGHIVETFVNSQRGFAFVRYDRRVSAEMAKSELDGITIRGKVIRVRFAVNGAAIRVRNIPDHVSNELLAEAFSFFGRIERAVVIVDDRGKPTGEGVVEFDRKNAAISCINKCNENCFVLTSELKPVDTELVISHCGAAKRMVDEEDGMPERNLTRSESYLNARSQMPRFVQPGTFDYTVCARWKELDEQRKQMDSQVKERIELAKEQLKIEIEQLSIDHQTYLLREDLARRESELRYLEEQRRHELEHKRNMIQQVIQQHQQYDFTPSGGANGRDPSAGNPYFQGNNQSTGNRMPSPCSIDDMSSNRQLAAVYAASKPSQDRHGGPNPYAYGSSSSALGSANSNQAPFLLQSQQQYPGPHSSPSSSSSAHTSLMAAAAVLNSAGLIPSNILQSSAFFQQGGPGHQNSPSTQSINKSKDSAANKGEEKVDPLHPNPSTLTGPRSTQQSLSTANSGAFQSGAVARNQRGNFDDHPRKRSRF